MCPFVTGFLRLTCFQGSPRLEHVSELGSFLLPNNIPFRLCFMLEIHKLFLENNLRLCMVKVAYVLVAYRMNRVFKD